MSTLGHVLVREYVFFDVMNAPEGGYSIGQQPPRKGHSKG